VKICQGQIGTLISGIAGIGMKISGDLCNFYSMKAERVLEFLQLCKENGIDLIIDGGWGVDALLGVQTREHSDLDIAISHRDVPILRNLLKKKGFEEIPRDDSRDCNFVLGDPAGNQIDVHSYLFDEQGNNIFGVPYLPVHFTGRGIINGQSVNCISAEWLIKFHTGYTLDENDYLDTLALCHAFQIPLPDEYAEFITHKKT
jgi:lincosamide nucleotidyltransferase A/C/D/E